MIREKLVQERAAKLARLDNRELVDTIAAYFKQNRTMPGEKRLKDYVTAYLADRTADLPADGFLTEFASVCVKDVRIEHVTVQNETKKAKELSGPKVSDLPMVLSDIRPADGRVIDSYTMQVLIISDGNVCIADTMTPFGRLPKGFLKNHPAVEGMYGTVIATDFSNGKLANMKYRMVIDLAQTKPALSA